MWRALEWVGAGVLVTHGLLKAGTRRAPTGWRPPR